MKGINKIAVICVDRDDDLGKKAGIAGPIIGRKENLNAAVRLALADPEDSDSNSMFAAVKKYDEIRDKFSEVEIITLTGHSSRGFQADKRINEQLDVVMEKIAPEGVVFVSDGADDDQVLPILQGRAPIISKQQVIVKQAAEVESTFYTIKEALKDPFLARVVFGIPGIILVLYAILYYLNYESFFFQAIAFILGVYLILKGTGLEEKIASTVNSITKSISLQRTSFPFYLAVIFIFVFGLITAYTTFFIVVQEDVILIALVEAISQIVAFSVIAALFFLFGRAIDAIHFNKAYRLGKYFLSGVFVILVWFIIEAAKAVVVGTADLSTFLLSIVLSFVVALLTYKVSLVFDLRKKVTKLLIGLPVYNERGKWIGKVEKVDRNKKIIKFTEFKTKKENTLSKKQFVFRDGRILTSATK